MLVEKINTLVTKMLTDLMHINTFMSYDGNVFVGRQAASKEYTIRSDDSELNIHFERHDGREIMRLQNWYSHSVNLSGVVFKEVTEDIEDSFNSEHAEISATINDGIGARYLYKALGKRRINVNFEGGWEDGMPVESLKLKSVSVVFYNETDSDLDKIYSRLIEQEKLLNRQLTISHLSNRFSNFNALTGLATDEFDKPYAEDNKFDDFFEED
jgi:hypothetical protein